MNYEIEHIKDIKNNTEVLQLILDGTKELLKNNMIDLEYGHEVATNGQALVAVVKKKIVGILTFSEFNNGYWISLSYILPKYRKYYIWYQFRQELASIAKQNKKDSIFSGVNTNNVASMTANAKHFEQAIVIFKQKV